MCKIPHVKVVIDEFGVVSGIDVMEMGVQISGAD